MKKESRLLNTYVGRQSSAQVRTNPRATDPLSSPQVWGQARLSHKRQGDHIKTQVSRTFSLRKGDNVLGKYII